MVQSVLEGLPWLHNYGKYARDVAKMKEETMLTKEEVTQETFKKTYLETFLGLLGCSWPYTMHSCIVNYFLLLP